MYVAEPEAARDVGEGAHVDDGGAQLGQLALGQVGVGAVQRVGDDQAEHGVAEELQPLVGRQAAVLVGVRAVGQGALEQARRRPRRRARDSRAAYDGARRRPTARGDGAQLVTGSDDAQPRRIWRLS